MYRDGTYGFPIKRTLAEMLIIDASVAHPPSGEACYERYQEDLMKGYTDSAYRFLNKAVNRGCPSAIRTMNRLNEKQQQRDRARSEYMDNYLRNRGLR